VAPLAWLGYCAYTGDLTPNPIQLHHQYARRLDLPHPAREPGRHPALRILSGWSWPITLRRLLGLWAFVYALLHFSVWVVLDHFFDWGALAADIVKRPYITVGMAALVLLVPLAATSTTGMIKRLGGRNWRRLPRARVCDRRAGDGSTTVWLAKKVSTQHRHRRWYRGRRAHPAPRDPAGGLGPPPPWPGSGGQFPLGKPQADSAAGLISTS
jgi:sulfoxide reductase heme-binding subunit YedZ